MQERGGGGPGGGPESGHFEKEEGVMRGDGRYQGDGGRFGRDFLTGCLAIVLILFILFVGIPIFVFLLKLSFLLVLPIGLILCMIVLALFLGRIINMFRER